MKCPDCGASLESGAHSCNTCKRVFTDEELEYLKEEEEKRKKQEEEDRKSLEEEARRNANNSSGSGESGGGGGGGGGRAQGHTDNKDILNSHNASKRYPSLNYDGIEINWEYAGAALINLKSTIDNFETSGSALNKVDFSKVPNVKDSDMKGRSKCLSATFGINGSDSYLNTLFNNLKNTLDHHYGSDFKNKFGSSYSGTLLGAYDSLMELNQQYQQNPGSFENQESAMAASSYLNALLSINNGTNFVDQGDGLCVGLTTGFDGQQYQITMKDGEIVSVGVLTGAAGGLLGTTLPGGLSPETVKESPNYIEKDDGTMQYYVMDGEGNPYVINMKDDQVLGVGHLEANQTFDFAGGELMTTIYRGTNADGTQNIIRTTRGDGYQVFKYNSENGSTLEDSWENITEEFVESNRASVVNDIARRYYLERTGALGDERALSDYEKDYYNKIAEAVEYEKYSLGKTNLPTFEQIVDMYESELHRQNGIDSINAMVDRYTSELEAAQAVLADAKAVYDKAYNAEESYLRDYDNYTDEGAKKVAEERKAAKEVYDAAQKKYDTIFDNLGKVEHRLRDSLMDGIVFDKITNPVEGMSIEEALKADLEYNDLVYKSSEYLVGVYEEAIKRNQDKLETLAKENDTGKSFKDVATGFWNFLKGVEEEEVDPEIAAAKAAEFKKQNENILSTIARLEYFKSINEAKEVMAVINMAKNDDSTYQTRIVRDELEYSGVDPNSLVIYEHCYYDADGKRVSNPVDIAIYCALNGIQNNEYYVEGYETTYSVSHAQEYLDNLLALTSYNGSEYNQFEFTTEDAVNCYLYLSENYDKSRAEDIFDYYNDLGAKIIGYTKADSFISSINSSYDKRVDAGHETFAEIARFFSVFGPSIIDGLEGWAENTKNFFSPDGRVSSFEYETQKIVEHLATDETFADKLLGIYDDSYQIGNSIGNMIPSLALSSIFGGAGAVEALGAETAKVLQVLAMIGTMGVSAAGAQVEADLQAGYDKFDAYSHGVLSGLSEVGLEMILGSLPGIGNMEKYFDEVGGFAGFIGKMLSEGFEESVQEVVDAGLNTIILGEKFSVDPNQVLKAGLYGAITSGLLSTAGGLTGTAKLITSNIFIDGINQNTVTTMDGIRFLINKYSGVDFFDTTKNVLNGLTTQELKSDLLHLNEIKNDLTIAIDKLRTQTHIEEDYNSYKTKTNTDISFEEYLTIRAVEEEVNKARIKSGLDKSLVESMDSMDTLNKDLNDLLLQIQELDNSNLLAKDIETINKNETDPVLKRRTILEKISDFLSLDNSSKIAQLRAKTAEILEKINKQGIILYDEYEVLKNEYMALQEKMSKDSSLDTKENRDKLNLLKNKMDLFETYISDVISKNYSSVESFDTAKSNYDFLNTERLDIQDEITRYTNRIEELNSNIKELAEKRKLTNKLDEKTKFDDEILKKKQEIERLTSSIKSLNEKLNKINSRLFDTIKSLKKLAGEDISKLQISEELLTSELNSNTYLKSLLEELVSALKDELGEKIINDDDTNITESEPLSFEEQKKLIEEKIKAYQEERARIEKELKDAIKVEGEIKDNVVSFEEERERLKKEREKYIDFGDIDAENAVVDFENGSPVAENVSVTEKAKALSDAKANVKYFYDLFENVDPVEIAKIATSKEFKNNSDLQTAAIFYLENNPKELNSLVKNLSSTTLKKTFDLLSVNSVESNISRFLQQLDYGNVIRVSREFGSQIFSGLKISQLIELYNKGQRLFLEHITNFQYLSLASELKSNSLLEQFFNNEKRQTDIVFSFTRDNNVIIDIELINTINLDGEKIYIYEVDGKKVFSKTNVIESLYKEDSNLHTIINDFFSEEAIEKLYIGEISKDGKITIDEETKEQITTILDNYLDSYEDYFDLVRDYDPKIRFGVNQNLLEVDKDNFYLNANMKLDSIDTAAHERLVNYFREKYNMSGETLDEVFSLIINNGIGACSYANVANLIFSKFKDNSRAFKQVFGFDMYEFENGKKKLNARALLLDIYVRINSKDISGGTIFEVDPNTGERKIAFVKDQSGKIRKASAIDQKGLSSIDGYATILYKYLKDYGIDFSYEELSHFDSNGKLDKDELIKDITQRLLNGELLTLSEYSVSKTVTNPDGTTSTIFDTSQDIEFENLDSGYSKFVSSWGEGKGHVTTIVGFDDEGLIVISWGEKYKIKFSDLTKENCKVRSSKITSPYLNHQVDDLVMYDSYAKMQATELAEAIKNNSFDTDYILKNYIPEKTILELTQIMEGKELLSKVISARSTEIVLNAYKSILSKDEFTDLLKTLNDEQILLLFRSGSDYTLDILNNIDCVALIKKSNIFEINENIHKFIKSNDLSTITYNNIYELYKLFPSNKEIILEINRRLKNTDNLKQLSMDNLINLNIDLGGRNAAIVNEMFNKATPDKFFLVKIRDSNFLRSILSIKSSKSLEEIRERLEATDKIRFDMIVEPILEERKAISLDALSKIRDSFIADDFKETISLFKDFEIQKALLNAPNEVILELINNNKFWNVFSELSNDRSSIIFYRELNKNIIKAISSSEGKVLDSLLYNYDICKFIIKNNYSFASSFYEKISTNNEAFLDYLEFRALNETKNARNIINQLNDSARGYISNNMIRSYLDGDLRYKRVLLSINIPASSMTQEFVSMFTDNDTEALSYIRYLAKTQKSSKIDSLLKVRDLEVINGFNEEIGLTKNYEKIYSEIESIIDRGSSLNGLNKSEFVLYLNESDLSFEIKEKLSKAYPSKIKIIEAFLSESNMELRNAILDYHFDGVILDTLYNLKELLNYQISSGLTISVENLKIYRNLLNFDNLSTEEKLFLIDELNNKNISEIFAKDLEKAILKMNSQIANSVLNKDRIQKFRNEELSKKYGIDVYSFDGEEFYALTKSTMHEKTNGALGRSYSINGKGALDFYNWGSETKNFVYGGLQANQILHVFPADSYSYYSEDGNHTKAVRVLMTPEELLQNTSEYNEILVLEQGNNASENDSKMPYLEKIALYCIDEITESDIKLAKENGVGIMLIDSKANTQAKTGIDFEKYRYYTPDNSSNLIDKVNDLSKFDNIEAIDNIIKEAELEELRMQSEYNVEKIKGSILSKITPEMSELEKARLLYLELGKRIDYSALYRYAIREKKSNDTYLEEYNRKLTLDDLDSDPSVICATWAQVYSEILEAAGFSKDQIVIQRLTTDANNSNYVFSSHVAIYVLLEDGSILIPDMTIPIRLPDYYNIKVGNDTAGFILITKEQAEILSRDHEIWDAYNQTQSQRDVPGYSILMDTLGNPVSLPKVIENVLSECGDYFYGFVELDGSVKRGNPKLNHEKTFFKSIYETNKEIIDRVDDTLAPKLSKSEFFLKELTQELNDEIINKSKKTINSLYELKEIDPTKIEEVLNTILATNSIFGIDIINNRNMGTIQAYMRELIEKANLSTDKILVTATVGNKTAENSVIINVRDKTNLDKSKQPTIVASIGLKVENGNLVLFSNSLSTKINDIIKGIDNETMIEVLSSFDSEEISMLERFGINLDSYKFKEVNANDYVLSGIKDGTMEVITAEKKSRIKAVRGTIGQEVISWSTDENGNPIKERVGTVTANRETGEPGWIVTKVDSEGNPIIDNNGNLNQWIIDDATFKEKYAIDVGDIYKPISGIQSFVKISENIILNLDGKTMKIASGGYINVTDPTNMYGISARDFSDTYVEVASTTESEETVNHNPFKPDESLIDFGNDTKTNQMSDEAVLRPNLTPNQLIQNISRIGIVDANSKQSPKYNVTVNGKKYLIIGSQEVQSNGKIRYSGGTKHMAFDVLDITCKAVPIDDFVRLVNIASRVNPSRNVETISSEVDEVISELLVKDTTTNQYVKKYEDLTYYDYDFENANAIMQGSRITRSKAITELKNYIKKYSRSSEILNFVNNFESSRKTVLRSNLSGSKRLYTMLQQAGIIDNNGNIIDLSKLSISTNEKNDIISAINFINNTPDDEVTTTMIDSIKNATSVAVKILYSRALERFSLKQYVDNNGNTINTTDESGIPLYINASVSSEPYMIEMFVSHDSETNPTRKKDFVVYHMSSEYRSAISMEDNIKRYCFETIKRGLGDTSNGFNEFVKSIKAQVEQQILDNVFDYNYQIRCIKATESMFNLNNKPWLKQYLEDIFNGKMRNEKLFEFADNVSLEEISDRIAFSKYLKLNNKGFTNINTSFNEAMGSNIKNIKMVNIANSVVKAISDVIKTDLDNGTLNSTTDTYLYATEELPSKVYSLIKNNPNGYYTDVTNSKEIDYMLYILKSIIDSDEFLNIDITSKKDSFIDIFSGIINELGSDFEFIELSSNDGDKLVLDQNAIEDLRDFINNIKGGETHE